MLTPRRQQGFKFLPLCCTSGRKTISNIFLCLSVFNSCVLGCVCSQSSVRQEEEGWQTPGFAHADAALQRSSQGSLFHVQRASKDVCWMSAVCLGARPCLVLVLMSRGTPACWHSGPPLWSLFACVRSCPGGGRLHLSPYFLWKYISFSELAALLAVLMFFCRSCGFWKLCGRVNDFLWKQTIYTCARVRRGRSCLAAVVAV